MRTTENAVSDKQRAYRRRIAAKGRLQFLADLPRETVAYGTYAAMFKMKDIAKELLAMLADALDKPAVYSGGTA
jgi:hypothetical protein